MVRVLFGVYAFVRRVCLWGLSRGGVLLMYDFVSWVCLGGLSWEAFIIVNMTLFGRFAWWVCREGGFSWCTCLCLLGLSRGFVAVRVFLGVYAFVWWVCLGVCRGESLSL
mgnify:CR=1 FL=1